jgi:glycosyltransferase involved in cell wall biosynthesis
MRILIADTNTIPATMYGGTPRVIWYLGKELVKMGHHVEYLVYKGSHCDFAPIIPLDTKKPLSEQIPDSIDIVSFHFEPKDVIKKPYMITIHGNVKDYAELDINTVFVSKNHAKRHGSEAFVYNGMDWEDYGEPDLIGTGDYFHFLGKAAWRVKNVKGAIDTIKLTKNEKLKVLGGKRFNIKMGVRFTFSLRAEFYGMVGGEEKNRLIRHSRGLVFPVRWNEPMGLAIIESLYFGCPVFGTPYGSLPEIVNKDVGFLTNKATVLAEAIENYRVFSRNACHEYARDDFNSRVMAKKYLGLFTRVLDGETLNPVPPKLIEEQKVKFLPWSR